MLKIIIIIIKRLQTSPQSPDLNPIETLWHILDIQVRKQKMSITLDIKQALREE